MWCKIISWTGIVTVVPFVLGVALVAEAHLKPSAWVSAPHARQSGGLSANKQAEFAERNRASDREYFVPYMFYPFNKHTIDLDHNAGQASSQRALRRVERLASKRS